MFNKKKENETNNKGGFMSRYELLIIFVLGMSTTVGLSKIGIMPSNEAHATTSAGYEPQNCVEYLEQNEFVSPKDEKTVTQMINEVPVVKPKSME